MKPEHVIGEAIERWNPSHIVMAISGGYDSLCMAHYVHERVGPNLPLLTYAIDTQLSADGWREWLDSVAHGQGWNFDIYHNVKGWRQYIDWVREYGSPYSFTGHTRAYARLKGRAFDAILRDHKIYRRDRILFLTGIRKYESVKRSKLQSPFSPRRGSACWANPIFYWKDEDILQYRIENGLPENPFYETVGGSGDCQCNWGHFITLRKLQQHSPKLAAGNVALIDEVSREYHGYGWDGRREGQKEMFADLEDDSEASSPFLCAGCSRSRTPRPGLQKAEEGVYEQMSLF